MLALIERCQNTRECCMWATDLDHEAMAAGCAIKEAESTWCSAGKPLVQTFIWMLPWDIPLTYTLLHPFMVTILHAVSSFSRITLPAYCMFKEHKEFKVLNWPPNSPNLHLKQAAVGCSGQSSEIHGNSTSQLKGSAANVSGPDTTARL